MNLFNWKAPSDHLHLCCLPQCEAAVEGVWVQNYSGFAEGAKTEPLPCKDCFLL